MVLDINLFRNPEDLAKVRASQQRRAKHLDAVDNVVRLDAAWVKSRKQSDNLNYVANLASKCVGEKMKAKEDQGDSDEVPPAALATLTTSENLTKDVDKDDLVKLTVRQLKAYKKVAADMIVTSKATVGDLEAQRFKELVKVGNLVPADVPDGVDEDAGNRIEKTHIADGNDGVAPELTHSHVDLLHMIGGVDYQKGSEVAGNRGYYLKGPAVFLKEALVQHAMHLAYGKGYEPLYVPFFMSKHVMQEVAQLSEFDDMLYKVTAKASEIEGDTAVDEKYLIATSEQPLCAYHRHEWLAKDELPKKYVGSSTCFRQEVGSHGRDTGGIFRVHQFEKIEQFVVSSPKDDESWLLFQEMIDNAEEFYKTLGFSYRIVNIVAGALNNAAAKKLDIECWFPGSKAYRELVSCSNCLDYQSRRLQVRYGKTKTGNTEYVHMLNSTLTALTRTICCLLETNQTPDGVVVPEVLKKHLPPGFPAVLPYVNEPIPPPAVKGGKKKSKAKK